MTEKALDDSRLRIRPMEHEDIGDVLAIDRKITGVRRAMTYTDLITGDLGGLLAMSIVAEASGQVVGFILARHVVVGEPVEEVGLIQIMGVDTDYWRQGIATKMVDFLLKRCQSKGIRTVQTMVNEHDSQLRGFFEHSGFRPGQLIAYSRTLEPRSDLQQ
jgi:GNAT superfamily N-acetyltransferase